MEKLSDERRKAMNKMERKQEILFLKHECQHPKRELIEILHRLESISKVESNKLGRIIGKLEDFQNR